MGEREWSDAVLMVNGQPVRVVPEVDFGGDIPDDPVARGISSIEFSLRITGEAMLRMANLISRFGPEFAQFAEELRRWQLDAVSARGWRGGIHEPAADSGRRACNDDRNDKPKTE